MKRPLNSFLTLPLFLLCAVLFLAGCIQQEVYIVLHSDGSGEYRIKKILDPMESMIGAAVDVVAEATPLLQKEKIMQFLKDEYPALTLKDYKHEPSSDFKDRYTETLVYSFENLGEAIPAFEEILNLNPHYAYREGDFVIFRNREKETWDGMSKEGMDDAYLNLTLVLPVEPKSTNGKVTDKTVTWRFDAEALKDFQKTDLGAPLIEARIPESAIRVDLRPRIVQKKKSKKSGKPVVLETFQATFPLVGKDLEPPPAKLDVYFPLGDLNPPLSYKELKVESLVVDEKEIMANLQSEESGVFNGRNQWGKDIDGFPIQIQFPLSDPWVKRIDRIEVSMRVNAVSESREEKTVISSRRAPQIIDRGTRQALGKSVMTSLEFGSTTALWPNPQIKLLTAASPNTFLTYYIDTDYGIRYEASGIEASLVDNERLKKMLSDVEGEIFAPGEDVYEYILNFEKIPLPSFSLVFVAIESQSFIPKTFALENIDLSPSDGENR